MLDKSIGIIAIQITTMVSTTLLRGDFPGVFCFISPPLPRDFSKKPCGSGVLLNGTKSGRFV